MKHSTVPYVLRRHGIFEYAPHQRGLMCYLQWLMRALDNPGIHKLVSIAKKQSAIHTWVAGTRPIDLSVC